MLYICIFSNKLDLIQATSVFSYMAFCHLFCVWILCSWNEQISYELDSSVSASLENPIAWKYVMLQIYETKNQ